jgi:hypothetical protein
MDFILHSIISSVFHIGLTKQAASKLKKKSKQGSNYMLKNG